MGLLKKTSIAAAILAPVLGLAGVNVASADTGPVSDAGTVAGSGTISPGVPAPGAPCISGNHVTFTGAVTAAPGSDDSNLNGGTLTFSGDSSTCDTFNSGSGTGQLGGVGTGTVNYSRTGNVVQVTGSDIVANGEAHTIINATCQFTPTNANPTTAYTLTCQVVLGS